MNEPEEHPSVKLAKSLPHPWCDHFPKSPEEARTWKPYTRRYALHSRVLVVATTRVECAWSAYCSDVPGNNHQLEQEEVLRLGDKIGERVARAMFPELDSVPYDR